MQAALQAALALLWRQSGGVPVRVFNDAGRHGRRNCGDAGKIETNLPEYGRWAMSGFRTLSFERRHLGRVDTPSSRWTPKKISVAAAGAGTWKAFSDAALCACASWTWNPKKCSKMLAPVSTLRRICDAVSPSLWPRPPPPTSTWRGPAVFRDRPRCEIHRYRPVRQALTRDG